MKSRITIEVDFDNGNQPIIQILHPIDSDDVRDKLISQFLQPMSHGSNWLIIEPQKKHRDGEARIFIRPVTPDKLREQAKIMVETADMIKQSTKK